VSVAGGGAGLLPHSPDRGRPAATGSRPRGGQGRAAVRAGCTSPLGDGERGEERASAPVVGVLEAL
jgi:hypothetical protein